MSTANTVKNAADKVVKKIRTKGITTVATSLKQSEEKKAENNHYQKFHGHFKAAMILMHNRSTDDPSGIKHQTDLLLASSLRIHCNRNNIQLDCFTFTDQMEEAARFTRGESIEYKSQNSGKMTTKKLLYPMGEDNMVNTKMYKALFIPEFLSIPELS